MIRSSIPLNRTLLASALLLAATITSASAQQIAHLG
jgi:hypothetical protein